MYFETLPQHMIVFLLDYKQLKISINLELQEENQGLNFSKIFLLTLERLFFHNQVMNANQASCAL